VTPFESSTVRYPGGSAVAVAEPLSSLDSLCVDSTRIGVDQGGRTVLLSLVLPGSREDFRCFLARCASVLSRVPTWTLRASDAYQAVLGGMGDALAVQRPR
jgi:hypothetical protein